MAARSVKLADVKAATAASVKAVLGKNIVMRRGVLVGLWIDKTAMNKLARSVASQVSRSAGIKVTPKIKTVRGGVLVGFIPPDVMKRR